MYVVEDIATDLPTAKTPRFEPRQCVEALTQLDFEIDVEEVGYGD
jgi:hypothetical protein